MSEHNPVELNFFDSGNDIYLDDVYYIAFSDQETMINLKVKDRMTKDEFNIQYAKYMAITQWPENDYKFKAIAELPPEENPNFIKITGRMIMAMVERGFVPQFDYNFKTSKRLVLVPLEAYEFYNTYSKAGKI